MGWWATRRTHAAGAAARFQASSFQIVCTASVGLIVAFWRHLVAAQNAKAVITAAAQARESEFDWSRPGSADDVFHFRQSEQDVAAALASAVRRNRLLVRFRTASGEILVAMPRSVSRRDLQMCVAEKLGVPCESLRLCLSGDALLLFNDGPREVTINVKRRATMADFAETENITSKDACGDFKVVRHTFSGELFWMCLRDEAKFRALKITERAYSERRILAELSCPHVVRLHHTFQTGSSFVYVMDHYPRGNLYDGLVAKGTPGLQVAEAVRLGRELLSALVYLHGLCIMHRDVKLENVLLNSGGCAVLNGFGLAKKVLSGRTKTMCGSYGYTAPEIMENTGEYGCSVDLYSFGVLLYMLLSGGEIQKSRPNQRLPPMRHTTLQGKLKDASSQPWAQANDSQDLLLALTCSKGEDRGTATSVQSHAFFAKPDVVMPGHI